MNITTIKPTEIKSRQVNGQPPTFVPISLYFGNTFTVGTLISGAGLGDKTKVEFCLNRNIDINGQDASSGRTALMEACQYGKLEMAKLLLEKGAKVTIEDNNGKTALDYVNETTYLSGKEKEEMIQLLVQAGKKGGPNNAGKKLLGRVRKILQSMLNQLRQFFNRLFRRG